MHDKIFDFAKDPSCILAVTPDNGGSWGAPLRSGGGCPWPSPTPRNFATEPCWWRDWTRVYREVVGSQVDFELLWNFEVLEVPTSEKSIFYASGLNCGVSVNYKRFIIIFRCIDTSDSSVYGVSWEIPYSNPVGTHQATIKRVGSQISFTFDGEEKIFARQLPTTLVLEENILYSNFGLIHEASIKKNEKTVWRYPSEAERVRLLTYNNVRTDRGVFEAADTTRRWNITTPLRWSSFRATTVVLRTTADAVNSSLFQMGKKDNPNLGKWLLRIPSTNSINATVRGIKADGTETWVSLNATTTLLSNKKHVFALSFDIDANAIALYMDGTLLKSATMGTIVNPCPDDASLLGFLIGSVSASEAVNATNRTDWVLVFDRALKPAEIAAIS